MPKVLKLATCLLCRSIRLLEVGHCTTSTRFVNCVRPARRSTSTPITPTTATLLRYNIKIYTLTYHQWNTYITLWNKIVKPSSVSLTTYLTLYYHNCFETTRYFHLRLHLLLAKQPLPASQLQTHLTFGRFSPLVVMTQGPQFLVEEKTSAKHARSPRRVCLWYRSSSFHLCPWYLFCWT